eukprot:g14678.t1
MDWGCDSGGCGGRGEYIGDATCVQSRGTYQDPGWLDIHGPAYWYVHFKDGEMHHVSKIRLWNAGPHQVGGALTPQTEPKIMPLMSDGLNGACVRFDRDGVKPTHKLWPPPLDQECDIRLPDEICSTYHEGPAGTAFQV